MVLAILILVWLIPFIIFNYDKIRENHRRKAELFETGEGWAILMVIFYIVIIIKILMSIKK